MKNLVKHKAYSIAKWEIDEALQEIQLNNFDSETTLKSIERINKYTTMLKDVLVEGDNNLLKQEEKKYE